jgi:hypothetical protein
MQVHYWSLYKKCLTPTMCSVGAFDDISSQLFVTRMLPVFSFSRQSKPILPLRRVGLFISCGLISINALYSESRGFSPGTSVSYTAGTGNVDKVGQLATGPFTAAVLRDLQTWVIRWLQLRGALRKPSTQSWCSNCMRPLQSILYIALSCKCTRMIITTPRCTYLHTQEAIL